MEEKTLDRTHWEKTQENEDIGSYGDPNSWQLLNKAWNKNEGWMKSTKVLNIPDLGCLVQVSTQQAGQIAEALTFVPGAYIANIENVENSPMLLPIKIFDKKEE